MGNADMASLQKSILEDYYSDNARKLHRTVDKILRRFGGLSDKDMDDFYSLANEVFVDAMRRYDNEQSFDGFLYSCLSNKVMTEITRRNREKRKADRLSTSLDAAVGDEEECSLLDLIPSDFDTFEEVAKAQEKELYQDKVYLYIARLSNQQVNILNLLIDGYKPNEVRDMLEISAREYADNLQIMRSYENIKILF
ncbi:MAG: hypothetical protein K2P07_15335 [Lachnospiraceae bacterium]|nr:hypothetical protein [Lachnospiraceae bacterium]